MHKEAQNNSKEGSGGYAHDTPPFSISDRCQRDYRLQCPGNSYIINGPVYLWFLTLLAAAVLVCFISLEFGVVTSPLHDISLLSQSTYKTPVATMLNVIQKSDESVQNSDDSDTRTRARESNMDDDMHPIMSQMTLAYLLSTMNVSKSTQLSTIDRLQQPQLKEISRQLTNRQYRPAPNEECSVGSRISDPSTQQYIGLPALPGYWKQKAPLEAAKPLPYTFDDCPFVLRQYACNHFDLRNTQKVNDREYVSTSCKLNDFDAGKFLQKSRSTRYIFIGDSTQRQAFISLVCSLLAGVGTEQAPVNSQEYVWLRLYYIYVLIYCTVFNPGQEPPLTLRAGLPPTDGSPEPPVYYKSPTEHFSPFRMAYSLGWPLSREFWTGMSTDDDFLLPHKIRPPDKKKISAATGMPEANFECDDPWFQGHCWYPYGTAYFPYYNVTIEYAFADTMVMPKFEALMQRYYPMRPNDVLHYHLGIHYHGDDKAWVNGMLVLFEWLDRRYPHMGPGQVFFREFSPSHHDFSHGTLNFTAAMETPPGLCVPLDDKLFTWRPYQDRTLELIRKCREGVSLQDDWHPEPAPPTPPQFSPPRPSHRRKLVQFAHSQIGADPNLVRSKKKRRKTDNAAVKDLPWPTFAYHPLTFTRDGPEYGKSFTYNNSRCRHFHMLPVHDAMHSQWDAHFGMFGLKPGSKANVKDCTHWCSPSAGTELWTKLFYNLLFNDR